MDLAAAERDRPYITGFLRAPPDFPGIFRRIFVHSNAEKARPQPPDNEAKFGYLRQPFAALCRGK